MVIESVDCYHPSSSAQALGPQRVWCKEGRTRHLEDAWWKYLLFDQLKECIGYLSLFEELCFIWNGDQVLYV